MQKVAIVTDGSCDLPKELVEKYNIHIVPMSVVIGKKVYKLFGDYGTITKDEFYKQYENKGEFPTTSLPTPKAFVDVYKTASKKAESIIGIILSEELSSTFQMANLALNYVEDLDITLIDSRVAASALGVLVIEAAKMAQKGKTKKEILKRLEFLIPQAKLVGILDRVDAVYRSGRITWGKKFLAERINIKPIIGFQDGKVITYGSVRANRRSVLFRMRYMATLVARNAITDTIFVWHVRRPDDAQMLKRVLEKNNPEKKEIMIQEAGPIVGTHVGLKAIAFMYVGHFESTWLTKLKPRKKIGLKNDNSKNTWISRFTLKRKIGNQ
ncbi:MAG: DegV family protein [Candidatus Heimdallarchaeota archaeon]|nr:DegV family protein [Candidatus Heimdallarchaeota archaeon]MBY8995007.1 DegV family protein [Candidatus Heimdallarchaeota archaeon]